MSSIIHVRQNDTAPFASTTLTVAGVAVDIENATIRFHMRDSAGALKIGAAASNDQVGDGSDGSLGDVSYEWDPVAGDTDQAGNFKAEWQVTFPDGTVRTFPTILYQPVVVHGELA